MKHKVYLTTHSKERFKQRTNYTAAQRQTQAKDAFRYGQLFSEFVDPMYSFLKSIDIPGGDFVAKVYQDYVYIFNNGYGHRLLTVYKVPDEYLPVDKYLLAAEDKHRCWIVMTRKEDGSTWYWSEKGEPTQDLLEILEFTDQTKARNYMYNNNELQTYNTEFDIVIY